MEIAVDSETGKAYAPVDKELTKNNQAVDAKTVGDKFYQYAIKNSASGYSLRRSRETSESIRGR